MELEQLGRKLTEDADQVADAIIRRWSEIGSAEDWLRLPDDLDHDHLPDLIRRMAEAALCTDFERDRCRAVLECSAAHGAYRASQGFDESLLYREYHLLRRALWHRIEASWGSGAGTYYASMRLDTTATLATSGALNGIHRDELERQGRWPGVLDEILDDWPLPRA